ncbi:MAG: hypothetical protein MMC33_003273 [Icmadophila ericetorum]|nr:hypothetical protein [Icmadophila ericetorum]
MDPAEMDSADIASQMGFASFGQQPSNKKRRYNPAADAVTSLPISVTPKPARADKLEKHHHQTNSRDRGHSSGRERAAGSNYIPLGVRSKAQVPMRAEEYVDMDEDDESGGIPLMSAGIVDTQTRTVDSPVDRSIGSGAYRSLENNDSNVQTGPSVNTKASSPGRPGQHQGREDVEEESHKNSNEEGEREGESTEVQSSNVTTMGPHNWAALRRGVKNSRGDVAYYDRRFVEDPWATLIEGLKE